MGFSLFSRSLFFAAGLTILYSCPNIKASYLTQSDEDNNTSLEKCLPKGLLDSQEIFFSPFVHSKTPTQNPYILKSDAISPSMRNDIDEQFPEETDINTVFSSLPPSNTVFAGRQDPEHTLHALNDEALAEENNTHIDLLPCLNEDVLFPRFHQDLRQALLTLNGEEKLTTRTFLNEKNIPIYKNVYYGLSNGFRRYIFEGSVLVKAGMHACRYLNLTSLYHNLTPLWENCTQLPHLPWMYLPRENVLFSGFITEPINPMFITSKTGEKSFDSSLKNNHTDRLSPDICGALFSSKNPFFLRKGDLIRIITCVSGMTDFLKGEQLNKWLKTGTKLCTPNNTTLCVAQGESLHMFSTTPSMPLSSSSYPSTSYSRSEDDSNSESTSTEENSTGSVRITSEQKLDSPQKSNTSPQKKALYPGFNEDFYDYFKNRDEIISVNFFNVTSLSLFPDIEYTVSISPNHSTVLSGHQLENIGSRLCAQLFLQSIEDGNISLWESKKKVGSAPWLYIPRNNPLFKAFMPTSFLKNKELCGGIYVKDQFFEILPDHTLRITHLGHRQTYIVKGAHLSKRLLKLFKKRTQTSLGLSTIMQDGHALYQWDAQIS